MIINAIMERGTGFAMDTRDYQHDPATRTRASRWAKGSS